jgi:hypothetical protein
MIMDEIIPIEEDILKTELWKKINHLREVIESHKGEIIYQVSGIKEQVQIFVGHANAEHSLLIDRKKKEIIDLLSVFDSKVKNGERQLIENVNDLFKNHVNYVDNRFREMKGEIDVMVTQEATGLFVKNEKRIIDVENKFGDLSKSVNEALSQYQVETRKKVGELLSKIEKVISKLKDGFQDL